jgi:hypothetical protein
MEEIPVTGIVWANFPIISLFVLAWVGVPLWLTIKRPHTHPDYAEARAYFRAKAAAQPHTSDSVPSAKVAAFDGLTVARQHLAPHSVVPGRRHATEPTVRTHPADSTARTGQHTGTE